MQQQYKQLAPTGVIQTCRQHCALQILSGDDKLAGHQLVTRRLSDARFAPPEIWQQAADALSQNPRQHPGFEQLAVSKAIEEFSCQYFLLTPGARRRRSETLRIAATPYFHLTWRLQRLNAALDFDASLLTELSPPQLLIGLRLRRLFALPLDQATSEARPLCHSICQSMQKSSEFRNTVTHLKGVAGFGGVLAKTNLVAKVRQQLQRVSDRKHPRKHSRVQPQPNQGSQSQTSWIVIAVIVVAAVGQGLKNRDGYAPRPSYQPPPPSASLPLVDFNGMTEREDRPEYVSPRFTDPHSTSEVFSNDANEVLRKVIQEYRDRASGFRDGPNSPWKVKTLPTLPQVSSPELFAVPEPPEAWTAPTNPAAERILQRHADLERLMKQLQPLPGIRTESPLSGDYQNSFDRLVPKSPGGQERLPQPPSISIPKAPGVPPSIFGPNSGKSD